MTSVLSIVLNFVKGTRSFFSADFEPKKTDQFMHTVYMVWMKH